MGNNIAIAAVLDDTAAENGGAVYLFDGNGNLITTLVSPQPVEFGSFGNALAVSSAGAEGTGPSDRPDINAAGRFVTFDSDFVNLVPDGTNGDFDIFVRDRQTRTTVRASVQ